MPNNKLPTLTSPIMAEHTIFPDPFTSPPTRPRIPQDLAAAQLQTTAQTAQPETAPVILLPETGGGLGGFVFAVVFFGFCALAAWVGREAKQ